jgi:hypothetical protein
MPMIRLRTGVRSFILAGLLASFGAVADDSAPAANTNGWVAIPGVPGTGCGLGGSYEFYVHRGDPKRLAIYFQGGGACWNSRNCGLDGRRMFDDSVGEVDRPWLPGRAAGIFDTTNPKNPLREFTIVLAPYCTADVHLGVRTSRFESADGKSLEVNHNGMANAQQAVSWLTSQYPMPRVVFVSGGSAGAIASPVYAAQLARHYQTARVVQLGDGAGGYRSAKVPTVFAPWGTITALRNDPLYADLNPATASFEDFYTRAAGLRNLRLAQVNSAEDAVQIMFLGELGHQVATLAPLLSGDVAEIRRVDSDFRTYTMPGTVHEILRRPEFYATQVDGVELSKWVEGMVQGRRTVNIGDALLPAPADRLQ